jgi:hypothetical protein
MLRAQPHRGGAALEQMVQLTRDRLAAVFIVLKSLARCSRLNPLGMRY